MRAVLKIRQRSILKPGTPWKILTSEQQAIHAEMKKQFRADLRKQTNLNLPDK